MKADDLSTIKEVLSAVYEIPFYQRSYVWEKQNWERMLEDIQYFLKTAKNPECFFMGAFIVKELPTKSLGGDRIWKVVDGQQRLTTMVLLLKAASLLANENIKDILFDGDKLRIRHNKYDKEIFENLIRLKKIDSFAKDESKRISMAFDYFLEEIGKLELDKQKHIIQVCKNSVGFVDIRLNNDDNEQQIFDTINSLGVDLTTAELLKNHLFDEDNQDEYEELWFNIFEKESEGVREFWDKKITAGRESRINVDLFLQAVLLIVSDGEEKYRKGKPFSNYKELLKVGKITEEELKIHIRDYANLYRGFIKPNILVEQLKGNDVLNRINVVILGLNITSIIPYVLYILKNTALEDDREKMFLLLESYLMRRIICKEPGASYNNFFAALIKNKITCYEDLKKEISKQDSNATVFPSDNTLEEGFKGSDLTNQSAKTILYLMESILKEKDDKYGHELKSFSEHHLEHLMPKNWINKWEKHLKEEDNTERHKALKKLGNLTLLSARLNLSIRDDSWSVKKTGRNGKGGLKEYASGYAIFSGFLEKEDWDESVIEERAGFLFKKAQEIWVSL